MTLEHDARRNNGFTLHGLWPNLDNHCPEDFPQVCYHSKFDSRKIPAGVLNDMETMWPSYKSGELHHSGRLHKSTLHPSSDRN